MEKRKFTSLMLSADCRSRRVGRAFLFADASALAAKDAICLHIAFIFYLFFLFYTKESSPCPYF
jgi:hypothetical protein